jgi:ribonuclease HI
MLEFNIIIFMITIFTDGAARGNPGPGGWGAIVATESEVYELGGREAHTTNNRMEILAATAALESLPKKSEVIIYTDSAYLLQGITRWVIGWQKNNWKTSQGEDVLNRDLWERLLVANKNLKQSEWRLLKGHAGIPANERCDVIATSFADQKPIVLYSGSRERYGVSLEADLGVSVKTKKKGRVKAYSYISKVGGVIQVHKNWEECRDRVIGVSGARFQKAGSKEEELEIIREFETI